MLLQNLVNFFTFHTYRCFNYIIDPVDLCLPKLGQIYYHILVFVPGLLHPLESPQELGVIVSQIVGD